MLIFLTAVSSPPPEVFHRAICGSSRWYFLSGEVTEIKKIPTDFRAAEKINQVHSINFSSRRHLYQNVEVKLWNIYEKAMKFGSYHKQRDIKILEEHNDNKVQNLLWFSIHYKVWYPKCTALSLFLWGLKECPGK